jgi:hypothetical protein
MVAAQMANVTAMVKPVRVQVANGTQLSCDSEVVNAVWFIGGRPFTSTLKVLLLSTYDLITGMDWLEAHSPMLVNWSHKWLTIPFQNNIITLHGIASSIMTNSVVQVCNLLELLEKEHNILSQLLDAIQALVQ